MHVNIDLNALSIELVSSCVQDCWKNCTGMEIPKFGVPARSAFNERSLFFFLHTKDHKMASMVNSLVK